MGYYINKNSAGETLNPLNKARQLILDGAIKVDPVWQENLICVVQNSFFDAAGYCFSENEFKDFNDPHDDRVKTWLTHPKAKELADYNQ